MKSHAFELCVGLALFCFGAFADGVATNAVGNSDVFDGDIGPHHRVWTQQTDGQGSVGGRVVEVATGMHYWDGSQWSPSDPTFETGDGSFLVQKVQHKLRLNGNINVQGAVNLTTPDGITLQSTPVAIDIYDPVSGQSTVVGAIQDSSGVQISSNQILFQNAFSGICASVLYTMEMGQFHQDIILQGKVRPSDYGYSNDTARIRIFSEFYDGNVPEKVIHPLFVEQDEQVRNSRVTPDLIDEVLGFGELVMGTGQAYTAAIDSDHPGSQAVVAKEFTTIGNRTFLIESVEYVAIRDGLEALPVCPDNGGGKLNKRFKTKELAAALPIPTTKAHSASLPPKKGSRKSTGALALAGAKSVFGVRIDYNATLSGTLSSSTVFRSDTTYFIAAPVFCNGSATFESAVFKFPNSTGTGATTTYIQINNTVTFKSGAFRPATFTAGDDRSIGEDLTTNIWSGYTGTVTTNYYANPALLISYALGATTLNGCRFRYAQEAIKLVGPSGFTVSTVNHSQFVNCLKGIELQSSGSGSGSSFGSGVTVTLNNCLMTKVGAPLSGTITGTTYYANVYHLTVDQGAPFASTASGTTFNIASLNSIFSLAGTNTGSGTVSMSGGFNGFYSTGSAYISGFGTNQVSASSNPFQSVGAGNYYLPIGSTFKNAGTTTGIGSSLLSDLRQRTTDPPILWPSGATVPIMLEPNAFRDLDPLDLGFHYDCLDYIANQAVAPNSGTVVLTNGVAVGICGGYGFSIPEGGTFVSEGLPLAMNRLAWYVDVQEQPSVPNVTTTLNGGVFDVTGATGTNVAAAKPVIQLRFTDIPIVGHLQNFFNSSATPRNLGGVGIRDCWLRGVALTISANSQDYQPNTIPTFGMTNNLAERSQISLYNGYGSSVNSQLAVNIYNTLFWQATNALSLTYNDTSAAAHPAWVVRDSLFDGDSTSVSGTGSYTSYFTPSYNAFFNTSSTPLTGTGNVSLTALSYGTGTPSTLVWYINSSTPALKDADTNRTADTAGLYHYTIFTSQAKETNSPVDIAFHYVALDSNHLPMDTDGDGIPDYLEDRNNNGTYDSSLGETDWQHSVSGLTGTTSITVYTPLK
jgi:hypothetical protein